MAPTQPAPDPPEIAPVIKKYRALVTKSKGLAELLLWGEPNADTRKRLNRIVMSIDENLFLDPEYTAIIQRTDMGLIEMSAAIEKLLADREAASAAPPPEPPAAPPAAACGSPTCPNAAVPASPTANGGALEEDTPRPSLLARLLCLA